jgi:D-alanyl-D-alanine dipeptidase
MGTQFDCFDPKSATASPAASAAVRANRRILTDAMKRHGFHNYAREWWHFTYSGTGADTFFDMPVVAPGRSN